MRHLQAATLVLIVLTIAPGYLFFFDVTPKITVLLLGTAALLALGAVRGAPNLFSVLILLNLASLAISAALSTRPGLSLIGTNWREFGLVPQAAALLFAWSVAGAHGSARPVLRAVALSGAAAACYGIAQYFGWDPLLPAAAYHIGEGIWTIVRPPGTLGYVSYFATWLAVNAFLSLALETIETTAIWRWIARGSAAICAIAMTMTGTRGAMLGLAAGVLVWLFLRGFRITRRMLAGAAAALLLCAAFYFSPAGWNLRSRSRWFAEDREGGGRLTLWRDTLRMAAHRPIGGYGLEVYTAEFARFESPQLAAALPDFEWESPHNMFLDALASQGILGCAALAALCLAGFAAAWRARTPESACLGAALAAGVVSQQFIVFTIPTAVLIYSTTALLCGTPCRTPYGTPGPSPAPRNPLRFLWIAPALVMLYCAVRLTVADAALAQAQHALDRNDESAAAIQYARYETWRFPGASADVWYSRASLQLAQKTQQPAVRLQALIQTQSAAVRAVAASDSPAAAWYNLSAFDAMRNDSAAVERDLRAAIAARPNWFKSHWSLARLLALESRRDEAKREAALAIALDGGKHPEVARTLMDAQIPLH